MYKRSLTKTETRLSKSLFILLAVLEISENSASSQCPDVPNSPYNAAGIDASIRLVENQLIPDCRRGIRAACDQAFRELLHADANINQMSVRCVNSYDNCRRTGLGNLTLLSRRVIIQADNLQPLIGGTHSYNNTMNMLMAWQNIRLCSTSPRPICTQWPEFNWQPVEGTLGQIWNRRYPPTGVPQCYTAQEYVDGKAKGDNVDDYGERCTKCYPPYAKGVVNGVPVCFLCPAGTNLVEDCCR